MKTILGLMLLVLAMLLIGGCATMPSAGEDFIQWQTSTDPKTGVVTQIGKLANTKNNTIVGLDVDLATGRFKVANMKANASDPMSVQAAFYENVLAQIMAKLNVGEVGEAAPAQVKK
jgi:predicted small secreted protein